MRIGDNLDWVWKVDNGSSGGGPWGAISIPDYTRVTYTFAAWQWNPSRPIGTCQCRGQSQWVHQESLLRLECHSVRLPGHGITLVPSWQSGEALGTAGPCMQQKSVTERNVPSEKLVCFYHRSFHWGLHRDRSTGTEVKLVEALQILITLQYLCMKCPTTGTLLKSKSTRPGHIMPYILYNKYVNKNIYLFDMFLYYL